jgi:hypothetical protein
VANGHNLVLTGPTGVGKTWLACALTHAAIRAGHTAIYLRTPRLADELHLGRADGRYARTLGSIARPALVVLDDFLLTPAGVDACRDLLNLLEERAGRRSMVVVSQLPPDTWIAAMADPTLAEAITASASKVRPCEPASPPHDPRRPHRMAPAARRRRPRHTRNADPQPNNQRHTPSRPGSAGTTVRDPPDQMSGIAGLRSSKRTWQGSAEGIGYTPTQALRVPSPHSQSGAFSSRPAALSIA